MYPKADGIAWSQDGGYYCADFMMNGYEKNVWFNAQGQWQMTQTEWGDTDELSATVYNAYASGPIRLAGRGRHLRRISEMATDYCH